MVKPRITSVKINFVPIITDEDKRRRKAGANAFYQMLLEDAIKRGQLDLLKGDSIHTEKK